MSILYCLQSRKLKMYFLESNCGNLSKFLLPWYFWKWILRSLLIVIIKCFSLLFSRIVLLTKSEACIVTAHTLINKSCRVMNFLKLKRWKEMPVKFVYRNHHCIGLMIKCLSNYQNANVRREAGSRWWRHEGTCLAAR